MKLVTPYTGIVVDVPAPFVERYKAQGYVEAQEKKPKAPKEEAASAVTDEQPQEKPQEKPKAKKESKK